MTAMPRATFRMRKQTAFLLLGVQLLCAGCPKRADTSVAGSDDDTLDGYSAKLDELKSRAQDQMPACPEPCSLARQACELSRQICEVSSRHADRPDMQQRCTGSQEDCARFNDACARCE